MASEVQLINATPIKKFIENGLNCKDPLKAFGHDAIEILTEIEFAPAIDPESLRPKGRDRLWRGGARGNGKSTIDLERNMRKIGVEITPKEAG